MAKRRKENDMQTISNTREPYNGNATERWKNKNWESIMSKSIKVFVLSLVFLDGALGHGANMIDVGSRFNISEQSNIDAYAIRNVKRKICPSGVTVKTFEYIPTETIKSQDIIWSGATYLGLMVQSSMKRKYMFPCCDKSDVPELLEKAKVVGDVFGAFLERLQHKGFVEVMRSQTLKENSKNANSKPSFSEKSAAYLALFSHCASPETRPVYCVLKNEETGVYCYVSAAMKKNEGIGWFDYENIMYADRRWFNDLSEIDSENNELPKSSNTIRRTRDSTVQDRNISLGMHINVNDLYTRNKYGMSNFVDDPGSPGAVGFDYVASNDPKGMPKGARWVSSAVVENDVVTALGTSARIYFTSKKDAGDAAVKAARAFAAGLMLDKMIGGSAPPRELKRSESLHIAGITLGSNATEEEKAIEALRVSARLGSPYDISVVVQNGSIITLHAIKIGREKNGNSYIAYDTITQSVDSMRD